MLAPMNKHVMHAANIYASTRKCGLVAAAKIYQQRNDEYHEQHVEATGDKAKCTLRDRHPTITKVIAQGDCPARGW